jgi:hypothetical protein
MASEPTVSGIRSVFYVLRKEAQLSWWAQSSTKLSNEYKKWNLEYRVTPLPELDLPRATFHRLLSIRSSHGDFSWYHTKRSLRPRSGPILIWRITPHTFNHAYAGTTTLTMDTQFHQSYLASESWHTLFRFDHVLQGKQRPRGV